MLRETKHGSKASMMVAGIFMAVLHTKVRCLLRAGKHGSFSHNYIHGSPTHRGEGRKASMLVASIFMGVLHTEVKRLLSDNYIHEAPTF